MVSGVKICMVKQIWSLLSGNKTYSPFAKQKQILPFCQARYPSLSSSKKCSLLPSSIKYFRFVKQQISIFSSSGKYSHFQATNINTSIPFCQLAINVPLLLSSNKYLTDIPLLPSDKYLLSLKQYQIFNLL